MVLYITQIVSTFPANYINDKFGVRVGMWIGSIIALIGIWLSCCVNVGYNINNYPKFYKKVYIINQKVGFYMVLIG